MSLFGIRRKGKKFSSESFGSKSYSKSSQSAYKNKNPLPNSGSFSTTDLATLILPQVSASQMNEAADHLTEYFRKVSDIDLLRTVHTMSHRISKSLSMEELVSSLVEDVKAISRAEQVEFLSLLDNKLESKHREIELTEGITGFVASTGQSISLNKPEHHRNYLGKADSIPPHNKTPRSLMCVPLISYFNSTSTVFGVLQLFNKEHKQEFNSDDKGVVYLLCGVAGNVFRNIKILQATTSLYEDSLKSQERASALLEVARSLSSAQTVESLAAIVTQKVQSLLSVERCTLFFVDRESNCLLVSKESSRGVRMSFLSWIRNISKAPELPFASGSSVIRLPIDKGIAGYVATTGEAVHITDAYKDARFNPDMDKKTGFRTRNMLCLPMKDSANVIIGVVQAINKDISKGDLNDSDQNLLETFTAHAAIASQNSKLMQQLRHNLAQSDALLEVTNALSQELKLVPLVKLIVSKVQSLLDVERCTVFIVDRLHNELYTTSHMSVGAGAALPIKEDTEDLIRFPMGAGIAGHVATTGEILLIPDAYQDARFNPSMDKETGFRTRNILCTPVRDNHGECVGVCQVMNKCENQAFTKTDESLLMAFSAQAAVAISNSRLFQETERALNHALNEVRTLKFMLNVTKNLSSEMQLSSIMRYMKLQLHELLKADHCYIYSVDVQANEVRRIDSHNEFKSFSLDVGLTGLVARTGEPVCISSGAMEDKLYDSEADSSDNPCKSFLCLPIVAENESGGGDVIGLISVQDEEDRGGFGTEEQHLIKVFCNQAAVSLINARKFSKLVDEAKNKQVDTSSADYLKNTRGMQLGTNDIDDLAYTMDEIQIQQSVGAGSYGEVFLAKARGKVVAVKKLFTRNLKGEQVDAFCSEASLMCQLRHPNVITLIGAVTQPPDLCILTDYCSRGSLSSLLMNKKIKMSMKMRLKCIRDAAAGMEYLHSSNPVILHRDLKSDNLLVNSEWTVKVADFGLTRFMDDKKKMSQVGTPMWMAPEVIMGEKYTEKADVYSFGIIIWEILTRKEPYPTKEAMQIIVEIVNDGLRPTVTKKLKQSPLYPLMVDCWAQDPSKRPNFHVVLQRIKEIKIEDEEK